MVHSRLEDQSIIHTTSWWAPHAKLLWYTSGKWPKHFAAIILYSILLLYVPGPFWLLGLCIYICALLGYKSADLQFNPCESKPCGKLYSKQVKWTNLNIFVCIGRMERMYALYDKNHTITKDWQLYFIYFLFKANFTINTHLLKS